MGQVGRPQNKGSSVGMHGLFLAASHRQPLSLLDPLIGIQRKGGGNVEITESTEGVNTENTENTEGRVVGRKFLAIDPVGRGSRRVASTHAMPQLAVRLED